MILTKFSQLFLKEMYGDRCGEFVCGSWGLEGQVILATLDTVRRILVLVTRDIKILVLAGYYYYRREQSVFAFR